MTGGDVWHGLMPFTFAWEAFNLALEDRSWGAAWQF